jgi:hypothetical protein
VFSYDVFFEKSEVEWSSRWDAYLSADAPNDKVQQTLLSSHPSVSVNLYLL